ncbi:MAG: hypothetical protein AAF639_27625, partial [Chloroflexota bacterium]
MDNTSPTTIEEIHETGPQVTLIPGRTTAPPRPDAVSIEVSSTLSADNPQPDHTATNMGSDSLSNDFSHVHDSTTHNTTAYDLELTAEHLTSVIEAQPESSTPESSKPESSKSESSKSVPTLDDDWETLLVDLPTIPSAPPVELSDIDGVVHPVESLNIESLGNASYSDEALDFSTRNTVIQPTLTETEIQDHPSQPIKSQSTLHNVFQKSNAEVRVMALRESLDKALEQWWSENQLPALSLLRDGLLALEAGHTLDEGHRSILLRTALAKGRGQLTALKHQTDPERTAFLMHEAVLDGRKPLPLATLMEFIRDDDQSLFWEPILIGNLAAETAHIYQDPRRRQRAERALITLGHQARILSFTGATTDIDLTDDFSPALDPDLGPDLGHDRPPAPSLDNQDDSLSRTEIVEGLSKDASLSYNSNDEKNNPHQKTYSEKTLLHQKYDFCSIPRLIIL